ncbi:MAG: hypothetical protein EOO50_04860 [Flavobacterium sp.]|uniref:hypothetical protein n=1 Tax=Flavobacterium sp. TaxID=239 RepID=UPI00120CE4C0|nr:hypothetical protein [Flavobacterium sp.]RZJ67613.1 MAG: hypothetical protein EOO50_04860 [Flavobacterium sp.]
MTPNTKALLYNFLGFAILYIPIYYLVTHFTNLDGWFRPLTSAVITTILSPKFQAVRTKEGMKVFMSWLFIKGIKEIK